uniref:Ribosomal protein l2 n=1 Tax=Prototheca stagnorum TaxID=215448 RepID=A0A2Z6BEN4_9CHLO|nr:ribosomal protein l2 [Prototheca stagnorum]BBD20182.1 ribosomal protein l2 [Prototheca stagnorum]
MQRFKSITPGRRHKLSLDPNDSLQKKNNPERLCSFGFFRSKGRNHRGVITSQHRGGGHKRVYRDIDFKRSKIGIVGKIKTVEYDPNRNALIALVVYKDGDKKYILYFQNLEIGANIVSSSYAFIRAGNASPLKNFPLGATIHNIELHSGKGGQLVRSAGAKAVILFKYKNMTAVRLPSGKKRFIPDICWVTYGVVGNQQQKLKILGKAGCNRWIGKRPHVRGSAMNAVDHPHGGGEGKAPIGRKKPYTLWGKPALGVKTRKLRKWSNLYFRKFKNS